MKIRCKLFGHKVVSRRSITFEEMEVIHAHYIVQQKCLWCGKKGNSGKFWAINVKTNEVLR